MEPPYLTIGLPTGDHLSLAVTEVVAADQQGAGDLRWAVRVRCAGFTSPECQFWVERSAIESFLGNLRRFEASRTGSAVLKSMSPDEFLVAFSAERPTHAPSVSGTVSVSYPGRARLDFTFELDSELVVQLLHDFERLLPDPKGS